MKTSRYREAQARDNLPKLEKRRKSRLVSKLFASRFLGRHVKRSLWSVWKPVLKGSKQDIPGYVQPVLRGSTDCTRNQPPSAFPHVKGELIDDALVAARVAELQTRVEDST